MTECDYCSQTVAESDYVTHLAEEHEKGELSRIDKRRVEEQEGGTSGNLLKYVGSAAVIVALLAIIAYFTFANPVTGNEEDVKTTPKYIGSVHYHGTLTVTVNGDAIDFSQKKYQLQADAAHFENGDGEKLHVHAKQVTIEYVLSTLGIQVEKDGRVTIDGTTYDPSKKGVSVLVTVNGEPKNPMTYVIQKGDTINVQISTQ